MPTVVKRVTIPGLRRRVGLLRRQPCTLIVDGGRLLVATATAGLRRAVGSAPLHHRYEAMSAETILSDAPGNFAIPRERIAGIRIEPRVAGGGARLAVDTDVAHHELTLGPNSPPAEETRDLLRSVFGELVS